jgi:signal transduction histidine kinase
VIRSVRGRLTLAVALVSGGLAIGIALTAPKTVENSLLDDRLDAEVDAERRVLDGEVRFVVAETGEPIGAAELTALFGPTIAQLTDSLEGSDALRELREFDDDARVFVAPTNRVIATVNPDGTVRVDRLGDSGPPGPVVTVRRLRELSVEYGDDPMFDGSFDMFDDDSFTLEELFTELDDRFGSDFADQLDPSVFENFPGFEIDEQLIPRDLFEVLERELFPAGTADSQDAGDTEEYVFGVRPVGDLEVIVGSKTDGIERSVDRVRAALWAAVPLAMLVGGGVTWLLAGRALRPVRTITERTSQIRSTTLHERVPVPPAGDELTALATEMNTMLDRVQREDDRRRQFVADASHELRSPLAAIRTQAEAALADPEADHELAAGILAEAERMSTLVDDLLSLARHDEALAPPGVLVDLDDVVLTEAARPRAVPVDVAAVSAGQVRGRLDELTRVVAHLLDNAARHADSRVAVGLESVGEHVMLTIDDDGPGVPPEQRERIFERFVRLDEARERDRGGAGLGLAVVSSVVRAGGGDVTVTDSELGGARFTIVLPAAT